MSRVICCHGRGKRIRDSFGQNARKNEENCKCTAFLLLSFTELNLNQNLRQRKPVEQSQSRVHMLTNERE